MKCWIQIWALEWCDRTIVYYTRSKHLVPVVWFYDQILKIADIRISDIICWYIYMHVRRLHVGYQLIWFYNTIVLLNNYGMPAGIIPMHGIIFTHRVRLELVHARYHGSNAQKCIFQSFIKNIIMAKPSSCSLCKK